MLHNLKFTNHHSQKQRQSQTSPLMRRPKQLRQQSKTIHKTTTPQNHSPLPHHLQTNQSRLQTTITNPQQPTRIQLHRSPIHNQHTISTPPTTSRPRNLTPHLPQHSQTHHTPTTQPSPKTQNRHPSRKRTNTNLTPKTRPTNQLFTKSNQTNTRTTTQNQRTNNTERSRHHSQHSPTPVDKSNSPLHPLLQHTARSSTTNITALLTSLNCRYATTSTTRQVQTVSNRNDRTLVITSLRNRLYKLITLSIVCCLPLNHGAYHVATLIINSNFHRFNINHTLLHRYRGITHRRNTTQVRIAATKRHRRTRSFCHTYNCTRDSLHFIGHLNST